MNVRSSSPSPTKIKKISHYVQFGCAIHDCVQHATSTLELMIISHYQMVTCNSLGSCSENSLLKVAVRFFESCRNIINKKRSSNGDLTILVYIVEER